MTKTLAFYFIILTAALTGLRCSTGPEAERFYGANFVGTSQIQKDGECFTPLVNIHANSVSIVPFCYGNDETGKITTEPAWQWWGESQKGARALIKGAKSKGLKVMVKPQIWFKHGTFTGHVSFKTEEAWNTFHSAYKTYLLEYAHICKELDVELFCIGTELGNIIQERPEFWVELIKDIKKIYSGKLTYAGNWDSYLNIPFWDQLDYIGVDAYFPISDEKTPSAHSIEKGWNKQIPGLNSFSKKHQKQILFTEFGYRSVDYAASKPWESQRTNGVNLEAQKNCFIGLFNSVWKEDFMSGGFIWKWYPNHSKSGGNDNNRFTPQNKPSEAVISKAFKD